MTQLLEPTRATAPGGAPRHPRARVTASAPRTARPGPVSDPRAGRTPRSAASRIPAPTRPHEWRTLAAVSVGVLAVLLLATWSVAQGWGRGPVAGPGELAVGGGLLRVDGVVAAAPPRHAMPGMGTDDDPVPDGHRRVSVDVTLMAGTQPVAVDTDRFALAVDGEPADHLTHRDVLPVEELPAGTRLSGTLVFDVPEDAAAGTLSYDGSGATEIVLPPVAESVPAAAGAPDAHGAVPGHAGAPDGHDAPVGLDPPAQDGAEAGQ